MNAFPEKRQGSWDALRRYGVAVAAVLLAALVRLEVLTPLLGSDLPLVSFLVAVVVAVWYGGAGPGLTALGLGTLLAGYLFVFTTSERALRPLPPASQLGMFVVFGLLAVWLIAVARFNQRRTSAALKETRCAEERMRLALEGAGMGWWELDLQNGEFTADQRAFDLFGLSSDTRPTVELILQMAFPEDRAMLAEKIDGMGRAPGDYPAEFRITRPDGQLRWIRTRGRAFHYPEGHPLRAIGLAMDITQQKQFEEQLSEARHAAEEANRSKDRFVAHVSHEMRTPVSAVVGMLDLALLEPLNPVLAEYLNTAKESAQALVRLLNDILDLSRIQAGRMTLEPAPFNLRETVDESMRALAVRARQKNLKLLWQIDPEVPDRVVGDRHRLRQVITNLVCNSVKFTPRGEVELRAWRVGAIIGRPHPPAGPEAALLKFAVRDTGIGIAAEDQEHLFTPFFQAAGQDAGYGGVGLGLAIVDRLVAMMGGRIWLESVPGRGSTFFFELRLPLPAEAAPAEEPTEEPPAVPCFGAPPTRPLRILLAEDNPANQKVTEYILKRCGHAVETVADGRQALEAFQRKDFDLVLMDVQMPVMNGFQATGAIRAHRDPRKASVPIVAMTAHAMKGDEVQCLEAGMDAYVSKPIQADQLARLIERLTATSATGKAARKPSEPSAQPPDEVPSGTVFDLDEAIRRCYGRREMFLEMVEYLFGEVGELLPEMQAALQRRDAEPVGQGAHRLRGTLLYLGAPAASEAALVLERLAGDGAPDRLPPAFEELKRQLARLEEALAPYRGPAGAVQ